MCEFLKLKSIEDYFVDWEEDLFGFGYGTGETPVLSALKKFFSNFDQEPGKENYVYDYEKLEKQLLPEVTWLLINLLCKAGHITYGVSPRYGFLTKSGECIRLFFETFSLSELLLILTSRSEGVPVCSRQYCHCNEDCRPDNPFWKSDDR